MSFDKARIVTISPSKTGFPQPKTAPMGWAYQSETDSITDALGDGYFDAMYLSMAPKHFIYAALTDGNVIFTVRSVDRQLKQVDLDSTYIQPSQADPAFTTYVYKEADFEGTDQGTSILLDNPQKYIIMDYVELSKPLVNNDEFDVHEFDGTFLAINVLAFTASNSTFYSGIIFVLEFKDIVVADSSVAEFPTLGRGNNTFVDIDGLQPDIGSFMNLKTGDPYNFGKVGTIKNMADITFTNGIFVNCGSMDLDNVSDTTISVWTFDMQSENDALYAGETSINFMGDQKTLFATLSVCTFIIPDNQYAVYIDPYIGEDSEFYFEDIKVEYLGSGAAFFKPGITGTITAFSDNTSTGSVTAISDNGDGTSDVTIGAHTLAIYQQITLSSMTVPAYDGSYQIINATATTVTIALDSSTSGTATGSWTANSVTATTVNTLSNGETLLIEDTANYNGGAKIYDVSPTEFSIDRTWVATETGTWDTGSLTQRDPRVYTLNVSGVPDSKSFFSLGVLDNPLNSETSIAVANQYVDLNLAGVTIDLNGTENFNLVDSSIGKFRYVGQKEITVNLGGFISGQRSGTGGQNRVFSVLPNLNDVLLSSTIPPSYVAVNADDIRSGPLSGAVRMVNGDEIRLQIANTATVQNFIVKSISFTGAS